MQIFSRPISKRIAGTPQTQARSTRESAISWLIALLALILRLAFVLSIDVSMVNRGGDTNWLLYAGQGFLDGTLREPPQVGPVFLIYSGIVQAIFGPGIYLPPEAVEPNIVQRFAQIRYLPSASWTVFGILNALMGAIVCLLVARLACAWFAGGRDAENSGSPARLGSTRFAERVGWLAALIIALDPTFIIESGSVLTESPFLVLLYAGLLVYMWGARSPGRRGALAIGVAGAVLALATLTRAVTLLLPAVLIIDLVWRFRAQRGTAVRMIATLVLAYSLVLSTWTVYNLVRWNRFIIGAEGIVANVYLGTQPDGWIGAQAVDQQLGITGTGDNQSAYAQSALAAIRANPIGYLLLRVRNLSEALLQPHNTTYFPGESIKAALATWWGAGHSLNGLGTLTGTDYFWPKLLLYVFHFGALGLGALGMLLNLRRLGAMLVPFGVVGYFLTLHFVLTAVPRYLFPLEPTLILFAGSAALSLRLVRGQGRSRRR